MCASINVNGETNQNCLSALGFFLQPCWLTLGGGRNQINYSNPRARNVLQLHPFWKTLGINICHTEMVHLCGISRPERDTSVRLGKKKAAARSSGDQFEEAVRLKECRREWGAGQKAPWGREMAGVLSISGCWGWCRVSTAPQICLFETSTAWEGDKEPVAARPNRFWSWVVCLQRWRKVCK